MHDALDHLTIGAPLPYRTEATFVIKVLDPGEILAWHSLASLYTLNPYAAGG